MNGMEVTSDHIAHAVKWLGVGILSTNPHQILVESNDSYIHKFSVHALNRNVDMNWVSEMKVEILKTIMAHECMTLTLAIDKRMVAQAVSDPDTQVEQGGFTAIVLDGQHRWQAMKQLKEEMPHIEFKIWLVIYLVENDAEIIQRLDTLNKRRNFSRADDEKVAVVTRFLQGFHVLHTDEYQSRRCIGKVRRSPFLRSEQFVKKHRTTTAEQFTEKIKMIAAQYAELWDAAKAHTKNNTLHTTIERTGMYQLMDESTKWLTQL